MFEVRRDKRHAVMDSGCTDEKIKLVYALTFVFKIAA